MDTIQDKDPTAPEPMPVSDASPVATYNLSFDEEVSIEEESGFGDTGESLTELKVYKRRWYMMFLYCMANALCEMSVFCFASIQDKAAAYYNVSNNSVSLMITVSFILCLFFLVFVAFGSERFGLYKIHCAGVTFLFVGAILRMLAWKPTMFWLAFVAQVIASLGYPFIVDSTMTLMAANWFPESERATSTSIAYVSMVLGETFIELLGPLIIHGVSEDSESVELTFEQRDTMEPQFARLYMILLVLCGSFALLTYFTFKSEPQQAPNYSSYLKRKNPPPNKTFVEFFFSVLECFKIPPFWPLFIGFGMVTGCVEAFLALINPILVPEGYTTKEAGYCGIAFIGIGFFGSFVSAAIADRLKWYKAVLRTNAVLLIGTAIWVYFEIRPNNFVRLFISLSVHGFFVSCILPVTLDVLAEVTHPVPESTTASLAAFLACLLMSVLTAIFPTLTDKDPPYQMKNSVLLYVILMGLTALSYMVIFGKYRRLETETSYQSSRNTESDFEKSQENTVADGDTVELKVVESKEEQNANVLSLEYYQNRRPRRSSRRRRSRMRSSERFLSKERSVDEEEVKKGYESPEPIDKEHSD